MPLWAYWIEIKRENDNSQSLLRYCSTELNFQKKNLAVYSKSWKLYISSMKKFISGDFVLKKIYTKVERYEDRDIHYNLFIKMKKIRSNLILKGYRLVINGVKRGTLCNTFHNKNLTKTMLWIASQPLNLLIQMNRDGYWDIVPI